MIKCLVTGANGFIGNALVQYLVATNKYQVFAMTRVSAPSKIKDVTYFEAGDISCQNFDIALLKDIEVVVHTAARVHVMRDASRRPLDEFRRVNVNGTLALASACAKAGVKRFIYLSSIGVNGLETSLDSFFSEDDVPTPHNDYALSKYEAEIGLKEISNITQLEVVIIRPPLVYAANAPGNFSALLRLIRLRVPLPLDGIHNKRSLISLDNLIDFLNLCIWHPKAGNEIFLVSDGHDLSTTELCHDLASAANIPVRIFYLPLWIFMYPINIFGFKKRLNGLFGNLRIDSSKAHQILGWSTPFSFRSSYKNSAKEL